MNRLLSRWSRLVRSAPWALAAALAVSAPALADPPQFSKGGFVLSLQYGLGLWNVDRPKLRQQVGFLGDVFADDAQNTQAAAVRVGYTILGHATVSAELAATGWNLTEPSRGGGGFASGVVTWHPLELLYTVVLKKEKRPLPIDAGTFFGVGYGLVGQRTGMDGLVFQWGLNADYWFARYFGAGLFARGTFLSWSTFYLDYNNRSVPGNTVALPQGSGGSWWHVGLSVHFRAGE